ncbi:MAG: hypothetical protein ACREOZ_00875, partial [Gloeomargaritales cyanobacterium]
LNMIPNERMPNSDIVNSFLVQITDSDYSSTIETCRHLETNLDDCIIQVRKKERYLIQLRQARRKPQTPHRQKQATTRRKGKEDKTYDFKPNEGGLISIPSSEWQQLSKQEKEYVEISTERLNAPWLNHSLKAPRVQKGHHHCNHTQLDVYPTV